MNHPLGHLPLNHGAPRRPILRRGIECVLLGMVLVTACHRKSEAPDLAVVATTTLVADAVGIVGGPAVSVTVLLPVGIDPHTFEPSPRDVSVLSRARIVFINGCGLESFLEPLFDNVVPRSRVVDLSEAVRIGEAEHDTGEPHAHAAGMHHSQMDPHVWFVPSYVALWARGIGHALAEIDPTNGRHYVARADSYATVLESLDKWVRARVSMIPSDRRLLVSDHDVFGHFARHFGFSSPLSLSPGISTLAEPSARELAAIVERVRGAHVPAVFVGMTAPGELAQRVASDAGVGVVRVYTGSLSGPDGPASSYVSFIHYNVDAIVTGLIGGA